MSVSGSYDNTTTMSEIITDALALVNAIDDSEPIPADKWNYGKRKLNQLMSFLSIQKGLWLVDDVVVTLTPGTASYTIGVGETVDSPKPMEIPHALNTADNDIPLDVVSREDYMTIPQKTTQSPPTTIYYKPGRTNGTLYVHPTGTSTNKTITLSAHRAIQDFDDAGNNPDFPKEWVLPVTYLLAGTMAPKYLGGEIPSAIERQATAMYVAMVNDQEEKVSIFIR